MMKCSAALALLLLVSPCVAVRSAAAASPRTTLSLNRGWRFHAGELPADTVIASGFDASSWTAVTIPHAFPPMPPTELGKRPSVYRGEAWYRTSFETPTNAQNRRVFLRFEAVSLVSEVFLNGQRLGEHRGGFAAFTFELTGKLRIDGPNLLAVRVDNRLNQDVSPIETSLLFGGIYRNVSLIVTGPIDITLMDYSSPGVFLRQSSITRDLASVEIKTEVDNATSAAQSVTVRMALLDASGKTVTTLQNTSPAASGTTTPINQTLTLKHPHLWNGVADPYLYSVRIDLLENDTVLDTVTQPLGLRFYRVDPKAGFVLNGVAQQIRGACLHQDWGDLNWAVSPKEEAIDLSILREMGATGLRLVHYQHSQSSLDLYDRTGMLIWSELAQFGRSSPSAGYRDSVRQQLIEMIRQNYNHPSIVMWSMYNELNSATKASSIPIVRELNVLSHAEDPTRPTVAAASADTIANIHEIVASQDLIGDNNYAGWYFGAPEDMAKEIAKWNAAYGNRGLGITEYGGGAKITDHAQNLKTGDVKPYGAFQPEEWQALVHEGNYRAMKDNHAVWGTFPWLAFDSGGLSLGNGLIEGGNIKGLVTQDRKTRKDAYFFYQANWASKPMAYITSRRQTERTDPTTPVKIYSNAKAVTLTVNGKSYGTEKPDEVHTFHWKNVPLTPGENTVSVTTSEGAHDEVIWTYKKP